MQPINKNFTEAIQKSKQEIQKELHEVQVEREFLAKKQVEVNNIDAEMAEMQQKMHTDVGKRMKDQKEMMEMNTRIRTNEQRIRELNEELIQAQRGMSESFKKSGVKDLR